MRIHEVLVLAGVVFVAAVLGLAIGCNLHPNYQSQRMPYLDLDWQPEPNVRPAERPVAHRVDAPQDAWDVDGNRPWKYIVVHHSATHTGSAESFDRMHRERGWDELGYHFVITNGNGGPDGQVQVGSRWKKQKWGAHTGGTPNNEYNNYGIGIGLVGDFTNRMPSSAQMNSLRKLVDFLSARYDIPAQNVIAHKEAPNASTECCGRVLVRYLQTTMRPELREKYYAAHTR